LINALRQVLIGIEWVLIGLFVVLTIILPLDLTSAPKRVSCPETGSSDCFPWGKSLDGPFGNDWAYESARNYQISGWFLEVVLIAMLAVAFWLPPGKRIIALAVGLLVLGLGEYILPRIA
jgi:hypothetical protein